MYLPFGGDGAGVSGFVSSGSLSYYMQINTNIYNLLQNLIFTFII